MFTPIPISVNLTLRVAYVEENTFYPMSIFYIGVEV